jgi:hypothetical protein
MAPLAPQTIPIQLGLGVGQHVDSKMLAGKMGDLRNARFTKALRYNKRTGFTGFLGNSTSGLERLGTFRSGVIGTCHDGFGATGVDYLIGSYSGGMNVRGRLFGNCAVDSQAIESSANDITGCDFATNGTYRAYAYEEAGVIKCKVRDDNGELVAQIMSGVGTTGTRPRVLFCNGKLLVGYLTATTQLSITSYDPTNSWTSTGNTTLTNVLAATPIWDWAAWDTFVVVAYNATGALIRLNKITASNAASSANQSFAATADSAIAVATPTIIANGSVSSTNVLIYYHDNTSGFRETRYDTSLVQQVAPTTLDATPAVADEQIIAAEYTAGIGYVVRQRAAAATYNRSLKAHITSAACASLGTATQNGCVLLSKMRRRGQLRWEFIAGHDSTLQSQSFLFDLYDNGSNQLTFAPTARFHYGVGGGLRASPTVANIDHSTYDGNNTGFTVWETAVLKKQKIIAQNGTITTVKGIERVKFDFRPENLSPFIESADSMTMAGGFLAQFDGISVSEAGFFMAPENVTAVQTVGGGTLSAGTYQFIVCYEWTDGVGRVHRSARSVPVSQAVSANDRVTLTIPTYRISLRPLQLFYGGSRPAVSIVVYRTTANGSVFYRDSSATSPTANDPTLDTVSYVSSISDTTLQQRDILYATGGVVDNYTVDAPGLFLQGPNRVYVESNGSIWPSKKITPGQGIAFAAEYERKLPLDGGRPTAMALMDDRVVVFRRREILSATGDGPDNTNTVDTLTEFRRLHDKIGCVGPNACVTTPLGILFKSDKGYYFLSRNLSLTYVGADIEDYNSINPYRAIFIPDRNEVRFKLTKGTGTVLVAVLSEADGDQPVRWTIDDNFDRISDLAVVGNTVWAARGFGLGGSGTPLMYYDDQTVFTDAFSATTGYSLSITTPWIKGTAIQGLMRIWRAFFLGEFKSTHTLNVEIGYNYVTSFQPAVPQTGANATSGGTAYQFSVDPKIQNAESIRFRISDSSPTGESFNLSAIELLCGVQRGLFSMASIKRVS